MKKVWIAALISDRLQEFLENQSYTLCREENEEVVGIVTSNKLHITQKLIDRLPQLQWIARIGSGMEIIDTAYCRKKNIVFFSSPKGIANSVAELTMGMLLNLLHRIQISHQEIKIGKWLREENRGYELENKTVGIIGYGHTGSAFAKKLSVFTSQILVYDKYKSVLNEDFVKSVTLETLCQESDIISFHVPLTEETMYYYNDDFLSATKNHILLNTSRGKVCHTPTILSGLQSGKIISAGLDVLEEEKNITEILSTPNNPIAQLLNYSVILTPHIAGYSHDAIQKMSDEIITQLQSISHN